MDCLKCEVFSFLQNLLFYITVHQVILGFTSWSPALNLKLLLKLASFHTWHNSVQVGHILDSIICQFAVVFAQHLNDLLPQSVLNRRMQCKLVQGECHCTSRSHVACYQKRYRLCHKQIAVYFWKAGRSFVTVSHLAVFLLRVNVALIILISIV